jgi:hypothetical protein
MGQLPSAGVLLDGLPWEMRWTLFSELSRSGPGLETRSYLRLFYDEALQQVNFNQTHIAAAAAELLLYDRRTVSNSNFDVFAAIADRLLNMDMRDSLEILDRLGLDSVAAEGAMAAIAPDGGTPLAPLAGAAPLKRQAGSAAPSMMSAAAPPPPGPATPPPWSPPPNMPFGDWDQPKGMPFWFYIGNAAHTAIAAYYSLRHPGPEHIVHLNTSTVLSIIRVLEAAYDFKAGRIRKALSRSKPDIFDFSMEHGLPPGWVYEIKSVRLAAVAEFEAVFYTMALTLAGVPVLPGPLDAPGTVGTVPAPGGWFQFWTPAPGAIVYHWQRPSSEELKKRKQEKFEMKNLNEMAKSAAAAGIAVSSLGLMSALIEFLLEGGWVLALA